MFDSASVTKDTRNKYTASCYSTATAGMITMLVVFPCGKLGKVKVFILRQLIKIFGGSSYTQTIKGREK